MTAADPTAIDGLIADMDHMQGVTIHGDIEFNCPPISFIDKNLWQGGYVPGVSLPPHFQHIISLYPWKRWKLSRTCMDTEVYISMLDAEDQAMDQVDALARLVNTCRLSGPVFVHCQAGLNRSSLVVARSLFLQGGEGNETGEEIVRYLRAARSPAVLCNPAFEAEVLSWHDTIRLEQQ